LRHGLARRQKIERRNGQESVGVCQTGVKRGVLWVFTDSLLKIRNAVLNAGGRETLQVIPPAQVAFIRDWVHFTYTAGQVSEAALLGARDGEIDFAGESLGNVEAGERSLVRQLQHDRVPVDQRGRKLPDRDREREVPRRDQRHDADRAATRRDLRIIVTGSGMDEETILKAIASGAKGYVDEAASPAEFVQAIRVVNQGSVWAPRKVLSMFIERVSSSPGRIFPAGRVTFTDREKEVLEMLVVGRSNKEIGAALGIEERTVKAHVAKLMRKVGVQNRIALSVHAITHSLVSAK